MKLWILTPVLLAMLTACNMDDETAKEEKIAEVTQSEETQLQTLDKPSPNIDSQKISLTVYKDPYCGCCSKWITHMEKNNFSVNAIDTSELDAIKSEKGIPAEYQSCHTGISSDGYFFEGHIPAKTIAQFLQEKPEGALGLTVPSMPVGSPGMEVDEKFMPYKVFVMKASGEMEVYAEFATYEEQF